MRSLVAQAFLQSPDGSLKTTPLRKTHSGLVGVVGSAFLTAVLLVGAPMAAIAEYIDPGDVEVKTERYTPAENNFSAGVYRYSVGWQGIPVADAEIKVRSVDDDSEKGMFDVTATANTASVISVFYRLRHTSNSVFDAATFEPVKFYSSEVERRKKKTREITFNPDGIIDFKYVRDGKVREENSFHSDNFTLDPISAAFVARSLPIDLGTTASFDVFNGRHRYLITCKVEGRETLQIAGKKIDSFRVVPTVERLTDTEKDERLQSATIWVSADSARHVLKIESKVWLGSVTAELIGFRPAISPDVNSEAEAVRASLTRDTK
jgi:hypothetical protein